RRPAMAIQIGAIQEAVATASGVGHDELVSSSRAPRLAHARQLAMYLSRELTEAPLAAIARAFDRDHTTVLYAIRAVEGRLEPGSESLATIHRAREILGITTAGSTASTPGPPASPPPVNIPASPSPPGEVVTLPATPLASTIDLVARAASRDEVRPILTGVLVLAEDTTLTMVATDSYRLSVKHSELAAPVAAKIEANVPAKALRELARII